MSAEPNQIISGIEFFLNSGLNRRYNPQACGQSFVVKKRENCAEIENYRQTVRILVSKEDSFFALVYRLPQTRIFYTVYQNLEWKISFIDYFNHCVVIVKNKTNKRSNSLTVRKKNKTSGIRLSERQNLNSSFQNITIKRREVFWFGPARERSRFKSVLHFLNSARDREYRNHPLNFFFVSDNTLLRKIDMLFADLPHINREKTLTLLSLKEDYFVWLQELFLQLGWHDSLLKFYRTIHRNSEHWQNFLQNRKNVLFIQRFLRILELHEKTAPQWLKAIALKDRQTAEYSFIELYFGTEYQIDKKLQQFWEYVQIPALELKWRREIRENADNFMAFVLLAVARKFWWAPQSYRLIGKYITGVKKQLFDLLYLLMTHVNISVRGKVNVSTLAFPQAIHRLDAGFAVIDYYRFGKKLFSNLQFPQKALSLKIDKLCEFEYDLSSQTIEIKPIILKPPSEAPELRLIRVETEGVVVQTPLVWEQFVFEINKIRFKWIRKKKRYQLSIKAIKQTEPVKICERIIDLKEKPYSKYYFPITSDSGESNLDIFKLSGERVSGLLPGVNVLTVRGIALDARGILKETFRYAQNQLKKNKEIRTNGFTPQSINAQPPPLILTLTAGKCAPKVFRLQPTDAFWEKFKNTRAEILYQNLKIWIDTKSSSRELRNLPLLCIERLGFIPEIVEIDVNEFSPDKETFNFLVSKNIRSKDEVVLEMPDIRVCRNHKSPKNKYFLINPEIIEGLFDESFFIQNRVKN